MVITTTEGAGSVFINAEQIIKVDNELADVKAAILAGEPVLELDPVDGWFQVSQINLHLGRADYHLGTHSPAA